MSILLVVLASLLALAGTFIVQLRATDERRRRLLMGKAGERRVGGLIDMAGGEDRLDDFFLGVSKTRSAQIDHLIRGDDCFVVVETKNWSGVLSGTEADSHWTLTRPSGDIQKMRNPLLQAARQAKVVARFSETTVPVKPIVVMAGKARHDSGRFPPNVMTARDVPHQLRRILKAAGKPDAATTAEVLRAWEKLVEEAYSPGAEQRAETYVSWLESRFGPKPWRVWLVLSLALATLVYCIGLVTNLTQFDLTRVIP